MNKIIKRPPYDLPLRIDRLKHLRGYKQIDVYNIVETIVDCPLSLSEFNKIIHDRAGNGDKPKNIQRIANEIVCKMEEEEME